MDDKGRLPVPSRYREFFQSASPTILTLHPHGCLVFFTPTRFAQIEANIQNMGNMGHVEGRLEEMVVGCAETVALDGGGRILIQTNLRARAKIQRDVLLFGLGDSIRLWDEALWEERDNLLSDLRDATLSEPWRNLRV